MNEMNLQSNKQTKKSGRIVGDTMGKYHPHGDSAVYDTIVRMTQAFSMRYQLVDGQGNFGSVDGDPPACVEGSKRFDGVVGYGAHRLFVGTSAS